jgi:diguanylate cyclase (GGDEF)-like protein
VIFDQIRGISERNLANSRYQIVFTLAAALMLAFVLLMELRALSKEKIEQEKESKKAFQNMANTDFLTGIRNRHAYSEYEDVINQKIRNGEIQELAAVACDINGLKHVNDTLGHAAGDKLIKDACALICEYFNHGAVFRIGGDEFAVFLQEKGYDTMKDTISALNRKIEENIAENGVVVAIGYSVLEEEDQQVQDVFDRADKMMYERKQELKAMGAKTREA